MSQYRLPVPRVSIVVPAYNAAATLAETLDSAMEQEFPGFELLVIDDGSIDETGEIARRYQEMDQSARVLYFYQEHIGAAHARNHGLAIARGEFVAFLDADDVWVRSKLREQTLLLEEQPSVDLVFSDCRYIEFGKVSTDTKRDRTGLVEAPNLLDLITGRPIAMSTVVARRDKVMRVGGFDESLIVCEDYDLWYRLQLAGSRFRLVDQVHTLIRLRPDSLSSNLENYRRDMSRILGNLLHRYSLTAAERQLIEEEMAGLPSCVMAEDEARGRSGVAHSS